MTARFFASAASALVAGLVWAAQADAQATVTVVNNDGPGEGFNDPSAVTPVAGNPGTTLGQQRLNAFQAAADVWGGVLTSGIEIRIAATMDPLTPCSAGAGVLGRAGPQQAFRDFTNAPVANTWYSAALANAISGVDNDATVDDVSAQFNSDVDDNPGCLTGTTWFYGVGVPAPANAISFFETVKHEIAHGLGELSFVDVGTGQKFIGRDDVFSNFLHDHSTGLNWSSMTDAERLTSITDTGDLHWTGARVNDCAAQILTAGLSAGHVRMFAPSPVQPGSSVSHFDTALEPDELMEPFATATSDQRLTDRLLADTGWDVVSPSCGPAHPVAISISTHNPAISPVVHNPPGSIVHHPAVSPVHLPVGSIHRPAGSFHHPRLSPVHQPFGSFHRPAGSFHNPPLSPGHQPFGSFHQPRGSVHQPVGSIHQPVGSFHQPVGSFHQPVGSIHQPVGSIHQPVGSFHQPVGSFHGPAESRFGGFDPGFDDPFRPGPMQPGMMPPGSMPGQPGGMEMPEGLEFVPGNRTGVGEPPMPRGMPYTQ